MQNQNTQVKEEQQKHYLRLEKPLEFRSTISGIITTAMELSKQINGLFSTLKDYEGCTIRPNAYGEIGVTLYFKDKGGKDIIPIYEPNKGADVKTRIMNMNLARSKNKTYRFADHVKDVLEQFVKPQPGSKHVNIDNLSYESFEPTYGGAGTIYLQIDNIDITRVLKTIYGSKAEDGSRYDYNVSLIKPINNLIGAGTPNYLFKVERLDNGQVEKLAATVGMIATLGTLPIVRDK